MLCMKFVETQTLLVKMHIFVRYLNHYSVVLANTVDLVTIEMIQHSSNIIAGGHQIRVIDITIMDREQSWFERGVK